MISGVYQIAGKNIRITSNYEDIHRRGRPFRTEEEPDWEVVIKEEDYRIERDRLASQNWPWAYKVTDERIEGVSALRKVSRLLLEEDTLMIHGSSVAVDGKAYLFSATSGTGKSTHARLWRETFGDRAMMINDDRPLLKISGEQILVYGSPFNGKHELSSNCCAPLQGIAKLERGEKNSIHRITPSEAWSKMVQHAFRPVDPEGTYKAMTLLEQILKRTPVWLLACNMNPEAAQLAYETMSKEDSV